MPSKPQKALSSKRFTEFLVRRAEELDEKLIAEAGRRRYQWHELVLLAYRFRFKRLVRDGWYGRVTVGKFKKRDGVSHTFDRINRIFPDLNKSWSDVIGKPCDPEK